MADLTDDEMAAIVTTWRERTVALQTQEGVAHVLIFENPGAMVGTSNPHPHCQIYAGAMVYATMAREAEVAREYQRRTGRSLLAEVVEREVNGPRVITEGEHFLACVPWFAQYAYEVHILPKRPVASLVDLHEGQCRSLALVLRDVVRRYDALRGFRQPYVLAVHQAPVGDHPHYPFHLTAPAAAVCGHPQVPGRARGGWSLHDERVRPRPESPRAPCRPRLKKLVASSARWVTTCATVVASRATWTWRRWRGRRWPTPSMPSTA